MINHRGRNSKIPRCHRQTKQVFQTGTTSCPDRFRAGDSKRQLSACSPGDKVLSVSIGVFGDQWANIAKQFVRGN
jgi:aspartate aminotransferase-like enzyme